MATEDDLRSIAMSLPEVEERASYGKRPAWRVRGRGFTGVWKDEASAVIVADSAVEKAALIAAEPAKFFSTPHYGQSARLLVRLAGVDVDELRELVTESWRRHAPEDLVGAF